MADESVAKAMAVAETALESFIISGELSSNFSRSCENFWQLRVFGQASVVMSERFRLEWDFPPSTLQPLYLPLAISRLPACRRLQLSAIERR